jgi:hypothetical protein
LGAVSSVWSCSAARTASGFSGGSAGRSSSSHGR